MVAVHVARNALYAARGKATEHPCAGCGGNAVIWMFRPSGPSDMRSCGTPEEYDPVCRPCYRERQKAAGRGWVEQL